MLVESTRDKQPRAKPDWFGNIVKFGLPNRNKAIWQLINTFVPYLALWAIMIYTMQHNRSYWLTLALAVPAAILLVRIFIFFHDCCHGSFFSSRRANRILGYITGILTFTPFDQWRLSHLRHHATAGDLDRRGMGDVWTMTVEEYLAAPLHKRFLYRFYRNPLVMIGLGPVFMFLLVHRLHHKGAGKWENRSVWITNLSILGILIAAHFTIGLRTYLAIQLPIIVIAGMMGIWLFYVQHQYENVYWARHEEWDPIRAALEGSSYYKLPGVLRWMTGNIGLHHIHHIRPQIPNYNLQRCCDAVPEFKDTRPLTIRKSLKSLWMNLWDEKRQKMVSFWKLRMP